MKLTPMLLTLALTGLLTSAGQAALIEFVPPNDAVGSILTTNDNDSYDVGRGLVFRSASAQSINSIGIFLDVSNVMLDWIIYQTTGVSGDLTVGQTLLGSGSVTADTTGLQWVDISIPTLALVANGTYHIQFSHTASANQNFFYNNANVAWTQGAFQALDGTNDGSASNSVVAAIRISTVDAGGPEVPEPATMWLAGGALLTVFGLRRRQTA